MSVSDFRDSFSNYAESFLTDLRRRFRRRKKSLKRRYRDFVEKFSVYSDYFLFDYVPFVLAYGLMVNVPLTGLLDWSLTGVTVVSYGVLSYLVVYDVHPMLKELLGEIG